VQHVGNSEFVTSGKMTVSFWH